MDRLNQLWKEAAALCMALSVAQAGAARDRRRRLAHAYRRANERRARRLDAVSLAMLRSAA
jgi:hypothetical protein